MPPPGPAMPLTPGCQDLAQMASFRPLNTSLSSDLRAGVLAISSSQLTRSSLENLGKYLFDVSGLWVGAGPALSTPPPPPPAQAPFRSPSGSLSHSSDVFSKPGVFKLKSFCQCLETSLVLLTSNGWKPGMLPSIFLCIGQPSP